MMVIGLAHERFPAKPGMANPVPAPGNLMGERRRCFLTRPRQPVRPGCEPRFQDRGCEPRLRVGGSGAGHFNPAPQPTRQEIA